MSDDKNVSLRTLRRRALKRTLELLDAENSDGCSLDESFDGQSLESPDVDGGNALLDVVARRVGEDATEVEFEGETELAREVEPAGGIEPAGEVWPVAELESAGEVESAGVCRRDRVCSGH